MLHRMSFLLVVAHLASVVAGDATVSWSISHHFLGAPAENCDQVCRSQGRRCEQDALDDLGMQDAAYVQAKYAAAGHTCSVMKEDCPDGFNCGGSGSPYISHFSHFIGLCWYGSSSVVAGCSKTPFDGNHRRLCPCVSRVERDAHVKRDDKEAGEENRKGKGKGKDQKHDEQKGKGKGKGKPNNDLEEKGKGKGKGTGKYEEHFNFKGKANNKEYVPTHTGKVHLVYSTHGQYNENLGKKSEGEDQYEYENDYDGDDRDDSADGGDYYDAAGLLGVQDDPSVRELRVLYNPGALAAVVGVLLVGTFACSACCFFRLGCRFRRRQEVLVRELATPLQEMHYPPSGGAFSNAA